MRDFVWEKVRTVQEMSLIVNKNLSLPARAGYNKKLAQMDTFIKMSSISRKVWIFYRIFWT